MPFSIRPRIRRAFRLALRRRDLTEAEVDEELAYHIELRVAQLISRGLTRDEAQAEARRRFGGSWDDAVRQLRDAGDLREERRHMRERFEALWSDVTYATRRLTRQPGFSLIVVLTFALGIGANATIFGVVDRLLLRPPPHVVRPAEVMQVGILLRGGERRSGRLNYPFAELLRADTAAFAGVIVSPGTRTSTLNPGPSAEPITTSIVNGGFFKALGTGSVLGRVFTENDDLESAPPVAVLSHAYWQRRFNGDRSIIGQTLRIGPGQFTVVGVAPPEFSGIDSRKIDAWIPLTSSGPLGVIGGSWRTDWSRFWLFAYVRLRPGVSEAAAAERIRTMYANANNSRNTANGPRERRPTNLALLSILPSEQLRDNPEARVSRLLVPVAALVLIIACANVANLLLARGAERRREIAVRLALGVSRARLIRLLVAETVILATVGGLVALLAARWGVQALNLTLLEDFAIGESTVGGRVVAVTAALVIFTTLVAGLVPALRASKPNVADSLKAGGREGSVNRSTMRTGLLLVQSAFSVILVVGAGLFVQSLRKAATIELGYEPDRIVSASLGFDAFADLKSDVERRARFEAIRERLAQIPGVAEATVSFTHPLLAFRPGLSVRLRGGDTLSREGREMSSYNIITANYFRTLGISLLDGRSITAADIATEARVAVVSQQTARQYWPNERAVGQCMYLESDSACTTIVGVAADTRGQVSEPASERIGPDARLMVYVAANAIWHSDVNVLLVRSRGDDASQLIAPIRRAIQTSAPNLPFADVQTFGELLSPQIRLWKVGATLFALFGGLALVVAAVGLYSAISYSVTQRRHEFGVRMALGAQVADVVRLVIGQGLRPITFGIVAGIGMAAFASRFVADFLFKTSPRSPAIYATVVVFMVLVALVASMIPARRASRVDPAVALRGD